MELLCDDFKPLLVLLFPPAPRKALPPLPIPSDDVEDGPADLCNDALDEDEVACLSALLCEPVDPAVGGGKV